MHSTVLPDLRFVIRISDDEAAGCFRFRDIADGASESDVQATLEAERSLSIHDTINIQFTSGTTGSPKGECCVC